MEKLNAILRASVAAIVATLIILGEDVASADSSGHPLDPLTATEYSTVVAALQVANHVDDGSRYPLITLHEPAKQQVLQWQADQPVSRQAFVIVKKGSLTFEAIVDIQKRQVTSWKPVKDVQTSILLTEEWTLAQNIVRENPDWQTAVRNRGIDNLQDVICTPLTVGYFGIEEEAGRRLVKVVCFDSQGISNYWARPIEGLIAIVD